MLFGTPAGELADDPEETIKDGTSAAAAPATVTDVPAEPVAQSAIPTPVYAQPPASGAAAVLLLTRGGSDEKGDSATPSAPAASAPETEGGGGEPTGEPTPGEAPATPSPPGGPVPQPPSPAPVPAAPVGPLVEGEGITYRLVQRDQGYFEGRVVTTNRTGKPMKAWKITFRAPRADVKNIWGARLVQGGEKVEIRNLEDVPAIPPGGTWEVRFGAAGPASTPKDRRLNGEACGF